MDPFFSDFDSFSESTSSEDQDDVEFPYDGHACSILSSLEETLGKIDDFLSFERGFVPGDIVCSVKDPASQMGKVIDVDIVVDLENIHGRKVQNVNSKLIKRIRSFSVGDFVVNGAWLGKIEKIVDLVTVMFDDGTKSEFSGSCLENLIPTSPDLLEDSQYPFYPGQRVQVTSSSASKTPRWFCSMKRDIKNQGTVCSVDAGLVYVDWLGCVEVNCERAHIPPQCQDSKNLTLLSCFSHANWQLGDWCCFPVIDGRSVRGEHFLDVPACRLIKGEEKFERVVQRGNFRHNFQEIAVITKMKTTVDVLWQDGSYSIELDSHSLLPVSIIDAHDFGPGQFVLEKGICDELTVPSIQRWGIVKSVDAKERTVKVKWCNVAVDQPTCVKLEQTEEIVSAYELTEHPDYSYCLGDAVFRRSSLCTKQSDENVFYEHLTSTEDACTESDYKYTDSCKDANGYSHAGFLSCIGIVVGLKDGNIEVTWASGATSKVHPYEIYPVENFEALSNTVVPYSENSDQANEGLTDPDNQSLEQREKDILGFYGCNEDSPKKLWASSSSSFPQAAMGLLTTISSALFGSMGTSLFGAYKNLSENRENKEEVLEVCGIYTGDTPAASHLETSGEANLLQKLSKDGEEKDHTWTLEDKYTEHFGQFDMVSDCADHHFVDGAGKGPQLSQIKRGWLKRVQQEWTILEKDLPETIYVRVYEERMDLLRAAIVGAPGTPYHDNLFFFDILLPAEYPHEPPMVNYNSGGLRVNPNLYETGKVCLSLLNTWTGSGSEVWNPENSSILQVLLSLQALVLNEKPYFNEAGYDSQIGKAEGEKNSINYNENAFLQSCKSMLYLLRKPPKHFEALVEEHFSQRCKHILSSCKAYMEGAPVGCDLGNEKFEQGAKNGSSKGFKIMLAKLFPKLVEAFADKGMDCTGFSVQSE